MPLVSLVSPAAVDPSAVLTRAIVYNNSTFDGNNAAANSADDSAIATDKAPLFSGFTASFNNYTSFTRGINAIIVDEIGAIASQPPSYVADLFQGHPLQRKLRTTVKIEFLRYYSSARRNSSRQAGSGTPLLLHLVHLSNRRSS